MKLQIVPSGMQSELRYQYLVSYVINDRIAIDAGCLGFGLDLPAQKQLTDLFLTHCHMDHVASLPIFLDNVYEYGPRCVTIHGSDPTMAVLRQDMFNDRIWPDFVNLSTAASPFLKLDYIVPFHPVIAGSLRITALPLKHIVPTVGYVIEDENSAIAIISDTHHDSGVWTHISQIPNLKAVLLECSFPNQLDWLADKSMHLIPRTFAMEARHIPQGVRILAIHIKPAWYDATFAELQALPLANFEMSQVGVEYVF